LRRRQAVGIIFHQIIERGNVGFAKAVVSRLAVRGVDRSAHDRTRPWDELEQRSDAARPRIVPADPVIAPLIQRAKKGVVIGSPHTALMPASIDICTGTIKAASAKGMGTAPNPGCQRGGRATTVWARLAFCRRLNPPEQPQTHCGRLGDYFHVTSTSSSSPSFFSTYRVQVVSAPSTRTHCALQQQLLNFYPEPPIQI